MVRYRVSSSSDLAFYNNFAFLHTRFGIPGPLYVDPLLRDQNRRDIFTSALWFKWLIVGDDGSDLPLWEYIALPYFPQPTVAANIFTLYDPPDIPSLAAAEYDSEIHDKYRPPKSYFTGKPSRRRNKVF